MIKIKSRNPKTASSRTNRDREQERRRVADENRRNKRRTVETSSRYSNSSKPASKGSRSGGARKSKFNGEEYFTFSLDGLIPAYGDPSQVSDSHGHNP